MIVSCIRYKPLQATSVQGQHSSPVTRHANVCPVTLFYCIFQCLAGFMRTLVSAYVMTLLLAAVAAAAPKPHVINFGKVMVVKWFAGTDEMTALDLKVRPLFVDAKLREFTLGNFHDVTDRLFVVRRAFRVNDALSDEPVSPKFWRWERDGWLLVDRGTGRISPVSLPEFDSYFPLAQLRFGRDNRHA